MARNLLSFPAIAALLAFAPAAYAADLAAAPVGPEEPGVAVGMSEDRYAVYGGGAVEADDGLGIDIDIDLGLFDDDDEAVPAQVYAEAPPEPAPYPPEPMITK